MRNPILPEHLSFSLVFFSRVFTRVFNLLTHFINVIKNCTLNIFVSTLQILIEQNRRDIISLNIKMIEFSDFLTQQRPIKMWC